MTLTYLNEKEKLDTLLYMSENMVSDNEEFQARQLRFIEIFLERFAKEMKGIPFSSFDIVEDKGVYWIRWYKDFKSIAVYEGRFEIGEEDYYEACIRGFNDFVDKYLAIHEMISKRMSMERYTNDSQEEYLKHFYMYTDVRWPEDVEYLKRIVNYGYPRYKAAGNILNKLVEYERYSYAEYGDPRVENVYPESGVFGGDFKSSNKPQWRPKKKHEKNELAAIDYYDKGLKRLNNEERWLKRTLEKNPNCIEAQMDVEMFVSCKNEFLGILINLEDEDLVLEENPFEDVVDYFMQEYTEEFIKHYENMGRYDIVNWMMG